jgi:hypothetical protein
MQQFILFFLLLQISTQSSASWLNCLPCLQSCLHQQTHQTSITNLSEHQNMIRPRTTPGLKLHAAQSNSETIRTFNQTGEEILPEIIYVTARQHQNVNAQPAQNNQIRYPRSSLLYYTTCCPPIH